MQPATENLAHKIQSLSPEQLSEVEHLIDALQKNDNKTLLARSEPSFAAIWNDPENDVYDAL